MSLKKEIQELRETSNDISAEVEMYIREYAELDDDDEVKFTPYHGWLEISISGVGSCYMYSFTRITEIEFKSKCSTAIPSKIEEMQAIIDKASRTKKTLSRIYLALRYIT